MGKGKKTKFAPVNLFEEKNRPLESLPPEPPQEALAGLSLRAAAAEFVPNGADEVAPAFGAERKAAEDGEDREEGASPMAAMDASEARWTTAEGAGELEAMEHSQRQASVDNVLARLLGEGLGASRESAAVDVAACVRAMGIAALWRHHILDALRSALDDERSPHRVLGGLYGVRALCETVGAGFEPYSVTLLPVILRHFGAKDHEVRQAAAEACERTITGLNPRAARFILAILFEGMESTDWRVKQGSVQQLGVLAKHCSSQLNICMPLIVPKVTTCLRDTKKEVARAARSALAGACSVIGNPDIEGVIPSVIAAIKNPEDTPQALEDLMHTTFVHPVDAATLAVIVPILARSLVGRGMHEKRKAATVIVNMCKLVLNPADVEPFGPKLLPELRKCSEEQAFEEIRGICANAAAVLTRAMGEAGLATPSSGPAALEGGDLQHAQGGAAEISD